MMFSANKPQTNIFKGDINMSKHTTLDQLKMLAQRTNTEIKAVDGKLTTLSNRVDDLVTAGGEPNVIIGIQNNGTDLDITSKKVDIGPSIAAAVAAADHLKRKIVTGVDAIDLAADDADQYLYMVPKTGSDADDVYDEYMVLNGAVEHVGNTKVDLSGYVQKETGKGLSANDYTDDEKAKLAGIEMATDAEVTTMLDEVFGTTEPDVSEP